MSEKGVNDCVNLSGGATIVCLAYTLVLVIMLVFCFKIKEFQSERDNAQRLVSVAVLVAIDALPQAKDESELARTVRNVLIEKHVGTEEGMAIDVQVTAGVWDFEICEFFATSVEKANAVRVSLGSSRHSVRAIATNQTGTALNVSCLTVRNRSRYVAW